MTFLISIPTCLALCAKVPWPKSLEKFCEGGAPRTTYFYFRAWHNPQKYHRLGTWLTQSSSLPLMARLPNLIGYGLCRTLHVVCEFEASDSPMTATRRSLENDHYLGRCL